MPTLSTRTVRSSRPVHRPPALLPPTRQNPRLRGLWNTTTPTPHESNRIRTTPTNWIHYQFSVAAIPDSASRLRRVARSPRNRDAPFTSAPTIEASAVRVARPGTHRSERLVPRARSLDALRRSERVPGIHPMPVTSSQRHHPIDATPFGPSDAAGSINLMPLEPPDADPGINLMPLSPPNTVKGIDLMPSAHPSALDTINLMPSGPAAPADPINVTPAPHRPRVRPVNSMPRRARLQRRHL